MADWIDGLDAARRAGWAKAYRMNEAHASATAIGLCLCSLVAENISGPWLRKVAAAAQDQLSQPSRVDVDPSEWTKHFHSTLKTFRAGNKPDGPLGWPVSSRFCV